MTLNRFTVKCYKRWYISSFACLHHRIHFLSCRNRIQAILSSEEERKEIILLQSLLTHAQFLALRSSPLTSLVPRSQTRTRRTLDSSLFFSLLSSLSLLSLPLLSPLPHPLVQLFTSSEPLPPNQVMKVSLVFALYLLSLTPLSCPLTHRPFIICPFFHRPHA